MQKAKNIFTSWRVLILIFFVLVSILAINPKLESPGIKISSVQENSSASINGVNLNEKIININDQKIITVEEYNSIINSLEPGILKIQTDENSYAFLTTKSNITDQIETGITVSALPTSNLKKGLDLIGGVRVLLKPEETLTAQQTQDIITITKERLNVFGLTDVIVRQVSDFEGNEYILVELAGAEKSEAAKLITQQGKFEAKIGEETVFRGDDIKQVWRTAERSGIIACNPVENGHACRFQFQVDIGPEAAKKHAEVTSKLDIELVGTENYLSEKLDLYLDDVLVESLYISSGLKGQDATSFTIQGSGTGSTEAEAFEDALATMKQFQTILITGSLPVKLEIVKMDVVSPTLGQEFFGSSMKALIAAIFAVGAAIFVRFRKLKIAIPIILTGLSELIIILGFAAFIKWNLDLAAIAGILAAIGTGVDDQIVITDEVMHTEKTYTWKERIKRAFFIIFGAYFTTVVAMLPLWAIGAGLLKGFALVTIVGVTIGVFITRPAYAKVVEVLLKE